MKLDKLRTGYLEWFKDLEQRLHKLDGRSAYYNLSYSSVAEPTDILLDHVRRYTPDLERRLKEPNPWGQPTLIDHIAARYMIDRDMVLLTTGASSAIFLACQALLLEGGHVIIETPVYQPLFAAPTFLGAEVSPLHRRAEKNYQLDLDELESKLTPQTKLIILSNLHNPSGAPLESDIFQEISTAARKYGAKVLVDEIYRDFVGAKQKPAAALDDVFISINSLSKVYGLSVLRCGWILAAPEIIDQIRRLYALVENIG
jgi:aspartate/methionine/tyrosine aminotransferase